MPKPIAVHRLVAPQANESGSRACIGIQECTKQSLQFQLDSHPEGRYSSPA